MSKYIGNCAHIIDWKSIIDSIKDRKDSIVKRGRPEQWMDSAVLDAESSKPWTNYIKKLDSAMYDFGSTCWHTFDVNKHYNKSVEEKLCKFLNVDLGWSQIHRVDPGCNCPIHIDNDGNLEDNSNIKVRYFIQISEPAFGQAFTVGLETLNFKNAGDIFLWDHYQQWHGAANFGFDPVYYFSFEAKKK